MPVKKCEKDGKPGYKYGDEGKCYTYEKGNEEERKKAKEKAFKQGAAIQHNAAQADTEKLKYEG